MGSNPLESLKIVLAHCTPEAEVTGSNPVGCAIFSFIVNGLENPQNLSAPQVKIRAPMGHLVVHDGGDIEAEARGSNPLSPTNISKGFGAF